MHNREEVPKPRPCPKCGEAPQVLATGIHRLDGHEFGFIFQCDCGSTAFDVGGSYTESGGDVERGS